MRQPTTSTAGNTQGAEVVVTTADPGWRQRAACRDLDTELFFPVGTTGPALDQTEQAIAVCARCPVAQACLDWTLQTNQQDGIWGGKTEDQRRALRRQRWRRSKNQQ